MGKNNAWLVVVTLTVAVAAVIPLSAVEEGEIEQFANVGAPVQLSETVPLNPVGVSCRL